MAKISDLPAELLISILGHSRGEEPRADYFLPKEPPSETFALSRMNLSPVGLSFSGHGLPENSPRKIGENKKMLYLKKLHEKRDLMDRHRPLAMVCKSTYIKLKPFINSIKTDIDIASRSHKVIVDDERRRRTILFR